MSVATSVGQHVRGELGGVGVGALVGERDGGVHQSPDPDPAELTSHVLAD